MKKTENFEKKHQKFKNFIKKKNFIFKKSKNFIFK